MTFAEKLSHVAKDDPKFARSVKRIRIASWIFGVAVVAALGFAGWALKIGFNNKGQITKIESPCLKYGAKSEQCKKAFEQAVLTITHAQACAILRKAGLEIRPCAHARLAQESTRRRERSAAQGGDAPQTGSTGRQQPRPHDGGVSDGAGRGGSGGPAAPEEGGDSTSPPPPVPEAVPPGRSGDAPGNPEPVPPASGAVPATVEAADGAVDEAVERVDCVLRDDC
jgi:hypothetical protein